MTERLGRSTLGAKVRWIIVGGLIAAQAFTAATHAYANSLDLRGWLDRPGVKLLAVEFYATWCEPCMKAVPRWKELHERYRRQGLRLVVVATQDPEGGCVNPGWNPDEVVCDDDGRLAQLMAADRLPAAFLWSWQGNLLVRGGHVDEVERNLKKWMRGAPRVAVQLPKLKPGAGIGAAELRSLVRHEVGRSRKLTVVATEEERTRLNQIKRQSYSERFDDAARCELGKELPPNSVLDANILGKGTRKRLRLGLLSLERGCLVASSLVDWDPTHPEVSVAEATVELVQKLRPSIQMPRGSSLTHRSARSPEPSVTPREAAIGDSAENWEPEMSERRLIVSLQSDPPGAVVMVDGRLLCQDTSKGCSRTIKPGTYTVTMQRERYKARSERVRFSAKENLNLEWVLEPNFGVLSVTSEPSQLELLVDGRAMGRTPLARVEVDAGTHEVLISDPCFFDKGRRVSLRAGQTRNLDFAMKARMGAIDIVAVDGAGNALRGQVFIDGQNKGAVPGVYKIPICSRTLEIRQKNKAVYRTQVSVEEKQLKHIRAVIDTFVSNRDSPTPRNSPETDAGGTRGKIMLMNDRLFTRYEMGKRNAEASNLEASLRQFGYTISASSMTELRMAYKQRASLRAVVVPELTQGDSRTLKRPVRRMRKYIRSYVSKGGTLIMSLDEPSVGRCLWILRAIFKWKLKSLDAVGRGSLNKESAQRLLLSDLPSTLPNNSDTDAIHKDSLPRSGRALYTDASGHAMVAVLSYRRGRVILLGWDWFNARPTGEQDGGWLALLERILR